MKSFKQKAAEAAKSMRPNGKPMSNLQFFAIITALAIVFIYGFVYIMSIGQNAESEMNYVICENKYKNSSVAGIPKECLYLFYIKLK